MKYIFSFFFYLNTTHLYGFTYIELYDSSSLYVGSIIGTLHGGVQRSKFNDGIAYDLMKVHDQLVVETDILRANFERDAQVFLNHARKSVSVSEVLTETELNDFLPLVIKKHPDISKAEMYLMHPSDLSQITTSSCYPQRKNTISIDATLIKMAKLYKYNVYSIENFEQQFSTYLNTNRSLHKAWLLGALKMATTQNCSQKIDDYFEKTYTYISSARYEEQFDYQKNFDNELLGDTSLLEFMQRRHDNMAQKIDSYLKQKKKTLVAIGVSHLGGENGILNILARKGYTYQKVLLK